MPDSIFDAAFKPSDCFLGVALPLSKEDLEVHWDNTEADFIQHMKSSRSYTSPKDLWEVYQKPANSLIKMMEEVSRLGVNVIKRLQSDDLAQVSSRAITIFAHYSTGHNKAELSDGLISPDQLANCLPKDYTGVVDLTLCNSINLAEPIKRRFKSNALVISNKHPATLSIRIILYKYLIQYLHSHDISYVVAVPKIRKMILS